MMAVCFCRWQKREDKIVMLAFEHFAQTRENGYSVPKTLESLVRVEHKSGVFLIQKIVMPDAEDLARA